MSTKFENSFGESRKNGLIKLKFSYRRGDDENSRDQNDVGKTEGILGFRGICLNNMTSQIS
jgi:hypothetical protein